MSKSLPYLDLRSISDCRKVETLIEIRHPRLWRPWIRLGRVAVGVDRAGVLVLEGFIGRKATDWEEDPPLVLRLPLELLQQEAFDCFPSVSAVILSMPEYFRVPPPKYDPFADPRTRACRECPRRHPIVPDEFGLPPENKAAYIAARGRVIRLGFDLPRRTKIAK